MALLHGVISRYTDTVPRPVTEVPSAVIALVGTAPIYRLTAENQLVNKAVRCESAVDDSAKAGPKTPGFTAPYALDAIRDNDGGTVEFINVFDTATHKTTAEDIPYTVGADGTIQLVRVTGTAPSQVKTTVNAENIENLVVKTTGGGTTYALTTDYTFDATTGIITRVTDGSIGATEDLDIDYDHADPSKVAAADIIGAVTGGGSTFTGLSVLNTIYQLRGYRPKIIICPEWSDDDGVAAEMVAKAEALDAHCLLDAVAGATRDEAIAGRAGTSPVTNFDTSSRQAILCYPRVVDTDSLSQPFSPYLAGVIARTDREQGYWWSPSNKEIRGITDVELDLTADPVNPSGTDVNALNAAGIVTIAEWFGSGKRVWGNNTALYPSDTSPIGFIPISRTVDIYRESLGRAAIPFVDRPLNNALIDTVLDSGNGFTRELIVQGALLEGSEVFYDKAKNLTTTLAAGQVTFSIRMMVPTPAQLIIFDVTLDISLLSTLGGNDS